VDHLKEAALLLVGHGSSRWSSGHVVTGRLAEMIRRLGIFAEVRDCYWKEPPFLSLDLVSSKTVYVVPNFAGDGVFTRSLLPEKLGLTGPRTRIGERTVIYCQPVGCHPGIATLLERRALNLCASQGIDPGCVALLVIAHGSRSGQPGKTPVEVASALRSGGAFGEVVTAYIEQEPRVTDWPALVACDWVIAAPLLISEGMHAREDLPPLFGLTEPAGGPVSVAGRKTWLLPGIGRDPEVVSLILDQVKTSRST